MAAGRRRRDRLTPPQAGALTLLVVALVAYLGVVQKIPFTGGGFEVKAAFRDSSGIKSGSPVRIAGVDVGKVTKVEAAPGSQNAAVVTMELQDKGRPLHGDATAKIRPRIFLEGNFFVDLTAGTPSTPELDEGSTIPASRTANPVQLGEVISALKADTRRNLQRTLDEVGKAERAGAAKAFNESLPDQEVAYRYSAIVADALLGEVRGDLGDWIRDQGVVAGALDRDRRAVRDLVSGFDATFGAIASREADLRSAVGELPRTLRTALPTLAALNEAFPSVRRFAAASLPAIRTTGPAVDATLPLVRQLRGAVGQRELRGLTRDLRTAVPNLAATSRETVGLLDQLRTLSSCISTTIAPFGNSRVQDPNFKATGGVTEEFAQSLVGLAGESRSFDGNGPWFKVLGQGGTETVNLGNGSFGVTSTPFLGVNPPADPTLPPYRPDAPCENQELPVLENVVVTPPQSKRYDTTAVRERDAKARKVAAAILNRQFKAEGSKLRVSDEVATRADVMAMVKRFGLADQLEELQDKLAAKLGKDGRP